MYPQNDPRFQYPNLTALSSGAFQAPATISGRNVYPGSNFGYNGLPQQQGTNQLSSPQTTSALYSSGNQQANMASRSPPNYYQQPNVPIPGQATNLPQYPSRYVQPPGQQTTGANQARPISLSVSPHRPILQNSQPKQDNSLGQPQVVQISQTQGQPSIVSPHRPAPVPQGSGLMGFNQPNQQQVSNQGYFPQFSSYPNHAFQIPQQPGQQPSQQQRIVYGPSQVVPQQAQNIHQLQQNQQQQQQQHQPQQAFIQQPPQLQYPVVAPAVQTIYAPRPPERHDVSLSPPRVNQHQEKKGSEPRNKSHSPAEKIISKIGQYSPSKAINMEKIHPTSEDLIRQSVKGSSPQPAVKTISSPPKNPNTRIPGTSSGGKSKDLIAEARRLLDNKANVNFTKSGGKKSDRKTNNVDPQSEIRGQYSITGQHQAFNSNIQISQTIPTERSKLVESLISPKLGIDDRKFQSIQQQNKHVEALIQQGELLEEERKALTLIYKDEEMRECTFHPNIEGNDHERRTLEKFLSDQKNFLENVESKRHHMRETLMNVAPEDETYHPEISQKSKKLAEQRYSGIPSSTVFERLYAESQAKKNSGFDALHQAANEAEHTGTRKNFRPTENTFTPAIQEKSHRIQREAPVEVLLYQDAMRRVAKQEKVTKEKPKTGILNAATQAKSKQMFLRKFLRRYDEVIGDFVAPGENTKMELLVVAKVLSALGYMVDSDKIDLPMHLQEKTLLMDLWLVLKGDDYQGITKRNLVVFLLAIFGLYLNVPRYGIPDPQQVSNGNQQGLHIEESIKGENKIFRDPYFELVMKENPSGEEPKNAGPENAAEGTGIGFFDQEGDFYLRPDDVGKIQKVYDIFYINHLSNQHFDQQRRKKQKQEETWAQQSSMTSKISINPISEQLAEQARNRMKQDLMEIMEKNDWQVEDKEKLTYTDLLILKRRVQLEAHKLTAKEKEFEDLKECTFHPKTTVFVPEHGANQEKSEIAGDNGDGRDDSRYHDNETPGHMKGKKGNNMPATALGKHRAFELYSRAKPSSQKRDRDPREIEYEKNCDECTFMPDISGTRDKRVHTTMQVDIPAKNIDLAIDRMRRGKDQRDQVQSMKTRGVNPQVGHAGPAPMSFAVDKSKFKTAFGDNQASDRRSSAGMPKMSSNLEERATFNRQTYKNQQQERYANDNNEIPLNPEENQRFGGGGLDKNVTGTVDGMKERVPLLFVDVNLGNGRTERIIVYEGDRSEELADRFGNEHGLDEEMKHRLKELLDSQIASLLTRIEEEMPSLQSDDDTSRKRLKQQQAALQAAGGHQIQESPQRNL